MRCPRGPAGSSSCGPVRWSNSASGRSIDVLPFQIDLQSRETIDVQSVRQPVPGPQILKPAGQVERASELVPPVKDVQVAVFQREPQADVRGVADPGPEPLGGRFFHTHHHRDTVVVSLVLLRDGEDVLEPLRIGEVHLGLAEPRIGEYVAGLERDIAVQERSG